MAQAVVPHKLRHKPSSLTKRRHKQSSLAKPKHKQSLLTKPRHELAPPKTSGISSRHRRTKAHAKSAVHHLINRKSSSANEGTGSRPPQTQARAFVPQELRHKKNMQWDHLMHRLGSKRYGSGVVTVAASRWQVLGEVGLVHAQWRRTENSRVRRTR